MRRVKHVLSYVLVLSMCFTLFFFPCFKVLAETYMVFTSGMLFHNVSNSNIYVTIGDSSSEIRAVGFYEDSTITSSTRIQFYLISENSFKYTKQEGQQPSSASTSALHDINTNGFYLYYANFQEWNYVSGDIPLIHWDSSWGTMGSDYIARYKMACYYTFGDGAVSPEPEGPTYGKPYDVEYSTRIAGSGLASADNIDRIVWNRAVDTNGNELPIGARVQIRAVPGKYVGNTANDVLTKTYTDFVLDHSKQLIIVDIIASRGVYETKWSEVVDHFGFFPYSWVPNIQYIDNEYFKMGWIYQIRLQVDDYYSDWTNIYTATGSGASESQTITDSDEISQQLVQDINIVNQLNNTSTTNWYINETTINNSEYTENTNGKPWWAYLLEAILSLFQINDDNQQTINNTNNLNIDLNDKLNEYNEIEDQQLDNLDTNLEAIEVESDMLQNNKFVGSANWVAQQYTRMTNGTVIGSLIGFSLLFGLALIFIGKIR